MRWRLFPALAALLLAAAPARGAEVARWRAGGAAQGLALASGKDAEWKPGRALGRAVAEIVPVRDPYRRAAFLLRWEREAPAQVWLTVEFFDRGYGLLALDRKVAQRDQHGVARLNSGRARRAVFKLSGKASAEIRLYGAETLFSVSATDTEPAREPLPEVKPAFVLQKPMDLVISAGADAPTPAGLPDALAALGNALPLARALGFTGIESYVKWDFIERRPGVFDWSYYDAVVAEVERHGLRWFPLLVVGSAYTLPDWFFESADNEKYKCLEHGVEIEIPTIFGGKQERYVRRFLSEFGKHYGSRRALLGVRLGPSANYGEAQYPATGAWGYKGRPLHTHIGYWAGDEHAIEAFRAWVEKKYAGVEELNRAWSTRFASFSGVRTFLPATAMNARMRVDFNTWYLDAMTEWCEKWARWAREAMPSTAIYQSSGGWGAVEIGTDYAAQTKSMARLGGGIRMTNENDSYRNNFGNTRLAASAARFYGAKLGSEPAGFSSRRGVTNRIYNALVNRSSHLFFYENNLTGSDQAITAWLRYAPLLDRRAYPAAEIAVYFPDTANKLRDDTLRYLRASAFLQRVHTLREAADFDLASERMILDGALDRYKALVIVWGSVTEKAVLDRIADWVARGGVLFYPDREFAREGGFQTVEGDVSTYRRWKAGETGKGAVHLFAGHAEPFRVYARYVREQLSKCAALSERTRRALAIRKPEDTYWTLLEGGGLALLHYGDEPATVTLSGGRTLAMQPYTIWMGPD
jgi:hypothetical protein